MTMSAPKHPSTEEWIKNMEYYKKWNSAIHRDVDGHRDSHTKWSKSERVKQTLNNITYMCNLKNGAAAAAKSLQSCPTVCDPIDGSSPGSPIPGILQARTLEWVAISFSQCMKVKSESEVTQLCPTLSNPMDCSAPGSSVHMSAIVR